MTYIFLIDIQSGHKYLGETINDITIVKEKYKSEYNWEVIEIDEKLYVFMCGLEYYRYDLYNNYKWTRL